jgi:hypothetical protein
MLIKITLLLFEYFIYSLFQYLDDLYYIICMQAQGNVIAVQAMGMLMSR